MSQKEIEFSRQRCMSRSMKRTFLQLLLTVFAGLGFTSCGNLPEKPKHRGPVSDESVIPWNRRQSWEGQGQFGGLGSR